MDLLNSFYSPEYESKIYKSHLDTKNYSKFENITKNISFPINIINDQKIKKCFIFIAINSGYNIESFNSKYENYIKIIFELLFKSKNDFNKLFSKYNLKYENKIYPEKIIIYLEFDYLGFNPIFSNFIKTLIFFDKLIVQNNLDGISNSINLTNNIDTEYLIYKKLLQKNLENNNNGEKETEKNLLEFFQYYFLKNKDKYITILSPYSIEKCKDIIIKIFDKYQQDFKNNIFKSYNKYKPLNIKFLSFDDPSILLLNKIDITKNNILKLIYFFPSLKSNTENILDYIVYMINGKRIGSIHYYLFKNKFIKDLNAYTNYSFNMPPQIIIEFKLENNFFGCYNLKLVISKLINFLRKLKSDINLIKITYENYKKMLLHNFNYNYYKKFNYSENKYYSFLSEFTHNFISLKNNSNNENNINVYSNLLLNRYLLPEYNLTLITNIINDIMVLKNLLIIIEIFPNSRGTNLLQNIKYSNLIMNNSIESNEFNTCSYAIIKKNDIINYAFTTQNYDNSSFKHKQDKSNYISKEINTQNYTAINNIHEISKIKLCLNNIGNKLWHYNPDNDDDINNPIIMSKFHFIHPNVRNSNNNISRTNIKYYNYINKKIEQEFEEILDMGNNINLTMDKNGINLELNAFKDIYIKILDKIFSFFFEFENDFVEYNDIDYITENFKSDLDKAIYHLQSQLKNNIDEKYFEEKNKMMDIFKLKLYGMNLEDNIYIEGLIYGNVDKEIIKKIKNVILKYNTREYDNYSVFNNTTELKKKILESKKVKEGHIYIYKIRQNFMETNINYFLSFFQILEFNKEKLIFLILIYLILKKHLSSDSCKIHIIYIDEIYYILIIRKSFDFPEYMAKHTLLNIKKIIDIICKDKQDKILKQILLNLNDEFCDKFLSDEKKFNFIWSEIYNNTYNFDFEIKDKKSYVEYIDHKIDLNEFKNYFKNNFLYKQRKIEFLFYNEYTKYIYSQKKDLNNYPWNLDFINSNDLNIHEFYDLYKKIDSDL